MAWKRIHEVRLLGLNGINDTEDICHTDTMFFCSPCVSVLMPSLVLSQVAVI